MPDAVEKGRPPKGLSGKLGSTVEYLGEFEAYTSSTSHFFVRAAESLSSMLSKTWSAIQNLSLPRREAA